MREARVQALSLKIEKMIYNPRWLCKTIGQASRRRAAIDWPPPAEWSRWSGLNSGNRQRVLITWWPWIEWNSINSDSALWIEWNSINSDSALCGSLDRNRLPERECPMVKKEAPCATPTNAAPSGGGLRGAAAMPCSILARNTRNTDILTARKSNQVDHKAKLKLGIRRHPVHHT
jgi:hypothetical protein